MYVSRRPTPLEAMSKCYHGHSSWLVPCPGGIFVRFIRLSLSAEWLQKREKISKCRRQAEHAQPASRSVSRLVSSETAKPQKPICNEINHGRNTMTTSKFSSKCKPVALNYGAKKRKKKHRSNVALFIAPHRKPFQAAEATLQQRHAITCLQALSPSYV